MDRPLLASGDQWLEQLVIHANDLTPQIIKLGIAILPSADPKVLQTHLEQVPQVGYPLTDFGGKRALIDATSIGLTR